MKVAYSFVAVGLLFAIAYFGSQSAGLRTVFGIGVPYLAFVIFVVGFIYRIVAWSKSPVPFRIPTTCGQQKSLPWIKSDRLDNPHDTCGVIGRMLLEVLFFRSLFRNTKAEVHPGPKVTYGATKWLWLAGLAFHYAFLVILFRHFRFFAEPVPWLISAVEGVDGFFEVGIPPVYITSFVLLGAVGYLFLRRIVIPQVKYISLLNDYFPLVLIFTIGLTGVLLRHIVRTDITSVKELAVGLITFNPHVPAGIDPLFFAHFFLVSVLFAYFPFSKLMHMGGVFMSPTRNLANNNRAVRHVNPWGKKAKVYTYEEYENEFREKMIKVGIPVEKEE